MVTDGVLATMPFDQMFKILGGDLETVAKKNLQSHEVKIKNIVDRADASHIKVEDLVFIKKLGSG
jgi:cGMP-dependent protein kinase